jgi:hypothetical protein
VFTDAITAVSFAGLHDIDLVAGPDFDIDVRDTWCGLSLHDVSNVKIDGFDLSGDGTRWEQQDRGLEIWGTNNTNITITNMVAQDRDVGIIAGGLIDSEISYADLSWTGTATPLGTGDTGLKLNGCEEIGVHHITVQNHKRGIRLYDSSSITTDCSRIMNNETGIWTLGTTANVSVHKCQIEGNTLYGGIANQSEGAVNGEYNYWGADDGPSNLGGTGDSYSGLVDADPFLMQSPWIDTTPPQILGVDVSTNLNALLVQLNDDDLHPTPVQNMANYKLMAAGADGVFGTDDDRNVAIDSIAYDAATDVIALHTSETLFDEVFRLAIDSDGFDDGTFGVCDLAGNFLADGDYTAVLNMTTFSLIEDTLTTLEEMGLSTGTENSLIGKLETAVKVLGTEANGNGVLALMDAFRRGILHQFDRGQLTEDQRDELLADTELIVLGITLTAA